VRRDAYPPDLTDLVLHEWAAAQHACGGDAPSPSREDLEQVLSASFQASLLRDEGRPITFRIALAGANSFDAHAGPPTGLHRLVFEQPRPLDRHELQRLSPAVPYSRSFIGAVLGAGDGPQVWGLVHSGPNWLQGVRGGRATSQAIPAVPMIAVTGPGRVLVTAGSVVIANLCDGTLVGGALDMFDAPWMEHVFSGSGEAHGAARAGDARDPAHAIDPAFGPTLARHVMRRVLAGIRGAGHGGMVLIVPEGRMPGVLAEGGCVRLKYRFADEEPRRRFSTLSVRIMNELAHLDASSSARPAWTEYCTSDAVRIEELDTAVFEVAHLVADLAKVDGAIVMTDGLDLLGFGGEIAGELPDLTRVARAVDLEGHQREWVLTDRDGTRHRSAYRLCHEAHDILAMVVSQDGGVRFVRWHQDAVTYWDQNASGPWEPS
jgi:hypothetical protein